MPSSTNKQFAVAPKGAAELVEVITLYKRFSKKELPPDVVADLCHELKDINIYIIKVALFIYKNMVARKKVAYHPRFFINLAKKQAKRIKNIPESFQEEDGEFTIPSLGKAI